MGSCEHHSCCSGHSSPLRLWHRWAIVCVVSVTAFVTAKPLIVQQLSSRATSYLACQLYSDAVRMYRRAIVLDSNNAQLWESLGYTYQLSQNKDLAQQAYRQAVVADPQKKSAYLSLGLILMLQDRFQEASYSFEQIRKLGPGTKKDLEVDVLDCHRSALRMLVTCYANLKDEAKRQSVLDDFKRYYPQDNFLKKF